VLSFQLRIQIKVIEKPADLLIYIYGCTIGTVGTKAFISD
jgi:hypothetical protein